MTTDDITRRTAIMLAAGAMAAASGSALATQGENIMERVTGIGGFFFRAKDPKALAQWYERHLGVLQVPTDYDNPAWRTEAGTTVFAPFQHDTSYFGDPKQQWMINFRVKNLDRMAAQLKAAGIPVEIDPETYPNGRFGKINDPEGNPIQLWEPGGKDPS